MVRLFRKHEETAAYVGVIGLVLALTALVVRETARVLTALGLWWWQRQILVFLHPVVHLLGPPCRKGLLGAGHDARGPCDLGARRHGRGPPGPDASRSDCSPDDGMASPRSDSLSRCLFVGGAARFPGSSPVCSREEFHRPAIEVVVGLAIVGAPSCLAGRPKRKPQDSSLGDGPHGWRSAAAVPEPCS